MGKHELTGARLRAVEEITHDLAVIAGAGAGKTSVLVDRFLHLARDPSVGPERVLAITFTRKAAVEMKERAVRELEEAGEKELRRRTEAAYISTIHGFAERVLRERPLAARIDPGFSVLTEYDQALFVEDALRQMYSRADLCAFARRLGRAGAGKWKVFALVREVARLMREGSEASSREAKLLMLSDDECVSGAIEAAREHVRRRERQAIECLEELLPLLRSATFKSRGKSYEQCSEYIGTAESCVGCGSLEGALPVLEVTRFTAQIDAYERPAVKTRTDLVREIARQLAAVDWEAQERLERELIPLKRAIYSAAHDIDASYAAHKQRIGALDFHDLQLRLRDLLATSENVRRGYAERFRHILLDEAQDTDELQYEIVQLLHDGGDSLFIVGDPKQAIYEFRGANPDVFGAAVARTPAEQRLELPENFRSRPEIISFINGLGPALLGDSFIAMDARAAYGGEPLSAPAVTAIYAVRERPGKDDDEPVIDSLGDARVREAAAVAEELVRLLRAGTQVIDPDTKEWTALRPRHIALLFRTRTSIPHFERALAERGVPYVTAAGQGFFERAEVLDCIMMLRALSQPLDDMALAAVLRSPFVGVSDGRLWRIRAPRESSSEVPALYHELRRDGGLRVFRKRFERLRTRTRSMSAADALDEAIRVFHYDAALAAHDDAPAMLANLAKLRGRLRELGALSVAEGHAELQRARELMASESTAALVGPNDDVVVLTTIHQAKGLEWPIVCLPSLEISPNRRGDDFSPRHGALLCKALDENGEEVKPLSVVGFSQELRARQEGEERRLLYVALTRARERLILSACVKTAGKFPEWKGEFSTPLGFMAAHTDEALSATGDHDCGTLFTSVRYADADVVATTQFDGGTTLANELKPRAIPRAPADPPPLANSALPLTVKVTELLAFNRCPQVYRFAHVLEIEEHTRREAVKRAEGDFALTPVELGTIVHSLLERADFHAGDVKAEVARLLVEQPVERHAALARMLTPVLTGPLGERVRAARRVEREWPFAFEAGGVLVEGVMDLAIQGPDGRWTVVDYKSNDLKHPGRFEELIEYYQKQLELYALALSRSGLGDVSHCMLLFLTGSREREWEFDASGCRVEEWTQEIIGRIAARDYETTAGAKCERCGYRKRRICPVGRKWTPGQTAYGSAALPALPTEREVKA
ncbi:MAG TPA: UvrD-helicase domain-containing protein [Gemmatimonadaceae bacterium]|nr:UvrD-helicase domain-containing protein [Gemmatimonadaceae bacterium]